MVKMRNRMTEHDLENFRQRLARRDRNFKPTFKYRTIWSVTWTERITDIPDPSNIEYIQRGWGPSYRMLSSVGINGVKERIRINKHTFQFTVETRNKEEAIIWKKVCLTYPNASNITIDEREEKYIPIQHHEV